MRASQQAMICSDPKCSHEGDLANQTSGKTSPPGPLSAGSQRFRQLLRKGNT